MRRKYVITLLIWVVIIGSTIGSRSLIFEDVQNSTGIVESDTPAGRGGDFIEERFALNGSELLHIVIVGVPEGENVSSPQWSNYTLFLTLYLMDTLKPIGYDYAMSAPMIIVDPDIPDEVADQLVSEDGKYALINIVDENFDMDNPGERLTDDVSIIRDLLSDPLAPFDYAADLYGQQFVDFNFPSKDLAKKTDLILTGTAANFADITETGKSSFEKSEGVAVLIALIILILVFRSPLGVLLPILGMVAALFPSYLITALLSDMGLFEISDFLPSVIAMIGIAVAIDYNLFSLVRYREEFRKRKADHLLTGTWNKFTMKQVREETAEKVDRTTGVAVMYSGFTVIIGFLALLLLQSEFTIGMAIGVSTVVFVSIFVTRTLTKSILGLFGDKLDWPHFLSGHDREIRKINSGSEETSGIWVSWSKLVMKYSIPFLIIGTLLIIPVATISMEADLSFDMVKNMPPGVESREGFEILQEEFSLGQVNPYKVVLDLGVDSNLFSSPYNETAGDLIDAINNFSNWAIDYEGYREKTDTKLSFDSVSTISVLPKGENLTMMSYSEIVQVLRAPPQIPIVVNGTIVSFVKNTFTENYIRFAKDFINFEQGNNTVIIEISSNLDAGSAAAWDLVEVLRDKVDEYFGPLIEDGKLKKTYVTGYAALFHDSRERIYSNVPLMLTVATILIFLALLVLFRSVILPIKAIITIVGSILFGLGTLVLIFQHGQFNNFELLGYTIFTAEKSGISFFLPTFLFTTLLGLGMDYSILIISRIKEEYEESGDMDLAVAHGISKTAGVISSAALIMITTFMVFATSPMLTLKALGVAMSVAVFIDASISRIILLPSAMKLAGKWNWWMPKWLEKILPDLHLEH